MKTKIQFVLGILLQFLNYRAIAAFDPSGSNSLPPVSAKCNRRIWFQDADRGNQSYYIQRSTAGNQFLCPGDWMRLLITDIKCRKLRSLGMVECLK